MEQTVTLATSDNMKRLRFVADSGWCMDIVVRYQGEPPDDLKFVWRMVRSDLDLKYAVTGSWVYRESVED